MFDRDYRASQYSDIEYRRRKPRPRRKSTPYNLIQGPNNHQRAQVRRREVETGREPRLRDSWRSRSSMLYGEDPRDRSRPRGQRRGSPEGKYQRDTVSTRDSRISSRGRRMRDSRGFVDPRDRPSGYTETIVEERRPVVCCFAEIEVFCGFEFFVVDEFLAVFRQLNCSFWIKIYKNKFIFDKRRL